VVVLLSVLVWRGREGGKGEGRGGGRGKTRRVMKGWKCGNRRWEKYGVRR